jgi:predicted small metal-binding protein
MRVIDCECGAVIQAANDDDLVDRVLEHFAERHPGEGLDQDDARQLVSDRTYTATDS